MHRIPKIFMTHKKIVDGGGGGGRMDSKPASRGASSAKPKPRLERRNAMKNIDYELPSTSAYSSDDFSSPAAAGSPAQRTRSLGVYDLEKQKSFRVEGSSESEFEIICETLGFSGPDDFAIPTAAWKAMKLRSSSDAFPRLTKISNGGSPSGLRVINPKVEGNDLEADKSRVSYATRSKIEGIDFRYSDSSATCPGVVNDVTNRRIEGNYLGFPVAATPAPSPSTTGDNSTVSKKIEGKGFRGSNGGLSGDRTIIGCGVDEGWISDRLDDSIRISNVILRENESVNLPDIRVSDIENGGVRGIACGGIKGVRPPALARPPAMLLPVIDNGCSTWDILRSFAPEEDKISSRFEVCEAVHSAYQEGRKREEEEVHYVVTGRRIGGESGLLSESCSFTTTSNDDDSSSTTTEPLSNISPNGRFRRVITNWQKGELLGRGSFGSVYEGIDDGGFFFAVKEVSLLDQGEEGRQSIYQLEQEIALLSQFEHENIVQYYGTAVDESKLYIFLEFVTKGSLLSLYQKYHLRDSQVSAYTRQILHGLKYLHDRDVVHRDIKCANILVDASGSVKLADFGVAKATKLNDVKSCKGTALWMAPEVVNRRNQGYGLAADIWSLGCTVLEMLTRQFPYSHLENQMQALFRIGKGEPPPVPGTLSHDARDFILNCLQVDPDARPTAAQLLDHPFVQRSLPPSGSASPYHPGWRV